MSEKNITNSPTELSEYELEFANGMAKSLGVDDVEILAKTLGFEDSQNLADEYGLKNIYWFFAAPYNDIRFSELKSMLAALQ